MSKCSNWIRGAALVLALGLLIGCSTVHSEIGEILDEKNSYSEYWQKGYPGHETGNFNRYKGRK